MINPGWIKLHRKLNDWQWYGDINVCRLWIHILLKVNHKKTEWRGILIIPGQAVIGLHALAKQTGLTVQQIRTSLNKLKSTNEITIKPTNKYSIITVTSWGEFQSDDDELTNKSTNEQQSNNNQSTTSKEGKKVKKDKKVSIEDGNLPIASKSNPDQEKPKSKKGTRIPDDWRPSADLLAWAERKGYSSKVGIETENFKLWWRAAAGQKGVKLCWDSTWQVWMNKNYNNGGPAKDNGIGRFEEAVRATHIQPTMKDITPRSEELDR